MKTVHIGFFVVCAAIVVSLDLSGQSIASVPEGGIEVDYETPKIADVAIEPEDPLDSLIRRGRLTPSVRFETYGGLIKPHPLVVEAALILSEELAPYARGVYVTSLARAPKDQKRLMRARRYRYWTVQRSKHLLGFAADIGFYQRRKSMTQLHRLAEDILRERLGEEDFQRLRVVRESRCIHVELHTWSGRGEIADRVAALSSIGILEEEPPNSYPIPSLGDYVSEREFLRRPRDTLEAVAH